MVNHGINTGALFLLVGMIYDRTHTRMIADFGGVGRSMPVWSAIAMVFVLASIGLPSTNGFAGEFLILFGAFRDRPLYGILGATGVVLGAVYMLTMVRKVVWGEVVGAAREVADLNRREVVSLVPLLVLVFAIGFKPHFFTRPAEAAVERLLLEMSARRVELDVHDGTAAAQALALEAATVRLGGDR
jgi:NADH-quinone oxidoreductase subunit M